MGESRFELFPPVPAELAKVWTLIHPMVVRLLERSQFKYTATGIFERILDGRLTLWLAFSSSNIDGIALSYVETWDNGLKSQIVEGCAGERADIHIESAMQSIEEYGRRMGCIDCIVIGRKAWVRKLPAYQLTHVTLRKIL